MTSIEKVTYVCDTNYYSLKVFLIEGVGFDSFETLSIDERGAKIAAESKLRRDRADNG